MTLDGFTGVLVSTSNVLSIFIPKVTDYPVLSFVLDGGLPTIMDDSWISPYAFEPVP